MLNRLVIISIFLQLLGMMRCGELLHRNCRNGMYARSQIQRFTVPDNLVAWTEAFSDYKPVHYESPSLVGKPWADPALGKNSSNRIQITI